LTTLSGRFSSRPWLTRSSTSTASEKVPPSAKAASGLAAAKAEVTVSSIATKAAIAAVWSWVFRSVSAMTLSSLVRS
jgi:hypothetical protein